MQCSTRILLVAVALAIAPSSPLHAAGKRYALVVGVKEYRPNQPLPSLSYPENDADRLAKVLGDAGYEVTLMTQSAGKESATLAPMADFIRDQLDALLGNPFLDVEEDVVIVALAGHGVYYDHVDPATGEKSPRFYFCPADADLRDFVTKAEDRQPELTRANDVTARNHLIDVDELYRGLEKCKAGGKLLLVDACRNDPSKPKVSRSANSLTLPPIPDPPGGVAAFFACSQDEEAKEDPALEHGVFFNFVIKGLSGDADTSSKTRPADQQITLTELAGYVSPEVYDHVRTKFGGARQTPELKGRFRLTIPLLELAAVSVVATRAGETRAFGDSPKIEMAWIPPGTFTMGSPASEPYGGGDEYQVLVTLSQGFWLGRHEVTQADWKAVVGTSPSYFAATGDGSVLVAGLDTSRFPVETVSWYDAIEFCNRLSVREGLDPYYGLTDVSYEVTDSETDPIASATVSVRGGQGYRLPTEAEWEYACRAGTTTPFHFGSVNDGSKANIDGDYPYGTQTKGPDLARTTTVGSYGSNAWGLHDMHGNGCEWCFDAYEVIVPGGRDPVVRTASEDRRVLRSGGWRYDAASTRSAERHKDTPDNRYNFLGFRVARTP